MRRLINRGKKNLACALWVIYSQCNGAQKIDKTENQGDPIIHEFMVQRKENEIDEMIKYLMGKSPDQWSEKLPMYFGEDDRNHESMVIISYCAQKKCKVQDYSLFLIYKKVNYQKCADLMGQPLVNPNTNEFIGCEPTLQNSKINPE